MAEWIDPRYAALAEAWRAAQEQAAQAGDKPPVRGFVVPGVEEPDEG
ncbi:hypothetical protein [Streptomyces varsoviensis]|nr:hypothetical protein [Streptomyces varsoviensis]